MTLRSAIHTLAGFWPVFLILMALFAPSAAPAAAPNDVLAGDLLTDLTDLNFEHLTLDDGLPENSVRAMLQDRTGFVWLGTQNGLVRYDGREMVTFTPIADDSTSFGGRTVDALLEHTDGDIWIGTFLAGLWRYNSRVGTFRRVPLAHQDGTDLLHVYDIRADAAGAIWLAVEDRVARLDPATERLEWFPSVAEAAVGLEINAILPDARGRVWCATGGAGLLRLDPNTGNVQQFRHDPNRRGSLAADVVYDLLEDGRGRIWVATVFGLDLWRAGDENFTSYVPQPDSTDTDINLMISLAEDPRGLLWVGSAGGLYVFDPDRGHFRLFANDPKRALSPVRGPILSVMVDRSGLVWGGSWHTGLNKVDPSAGRFRLRQFAMPEANLSSAAVEAIYEDSRGRLWVAVGERARGLGRGRLYVRESADETFRPVVFRSATRSGFPVGICVQEMDDGVVYVGTSRGLWQYVDGAVTPIGELVPGLPLNLTDGNVKDVAQDHAGNLWVATWTGLVRWHRPTGQVDIFNHDPADEHSLSWDDPVTLHVGRDGRVWTGSDTRGLNLYRPQTNDFQRFWAPERGLETVSGIHEDSDGILWLATYAGLVRFETRDGSTRIFSRLDGLPSDQVASVIADPDGTLWLTTGNGIAGFDPQTHTVRSYDIRDGLHFQEARFASARDTDGRLYFGGASGMVIMEPRRFRSSLFEAPIVVTRVSVGDAPAAVGPDAPLPVLPHLAERVVLPHDRNDVSFGFAALDFARPDQNRYLFRLDGADEEWRDPGKAPSATYSNLPPGHYVFRVRGSNRDGMWTPAEASLRLRILPPWWLTGWAWTVYVLLALAALAAALRLTTNRERMRASLRLQQAEAAKLHELDDFKTRFLTNITHEFRTPLTLIKAPLQRLCEEAGEPGDERLDTMVRNANRLEGLIDQLLDLSRLEAGRLPLRWQHGDCLTMLRAFAAGFESLAARRKLTLTVPADAAPSETWYDGEMLERMVGNLLTNAVKNTPDGGLITVTATLADAGEVPPPGATTGEPDAAIAANTLTIAVSNSGSFIPAQEQARVFDRFYQPSRVAGSGVGLALVKELAEWMGGSVAVESDEQLGTCFSLEVPVFLNHPEGSAAELAANSPAAGRETDAEEDTDDEFESGPPRILVVDDSADLRAFLAADLRSEYTVLEASDGREALASAIAEIPDLVLSDVMMPGMDGFELCRSLKEDERTSHVPVILLTARAETESRHSGLRLGADDYVAKPFDVQDLRLRIDNLITQRRKLAEAFERRLSVLAPDAMPVTSADERFIASMRQAIDANLDDNDFRINELCVEVGMSRSQLHRKLTAVTGKTTSEFVRTHRLQRAAQLFDGGYGNVTEVAYAVGFRNLSYFARHFRDLYGKHPSEYLRDVGAT